MNTNNILNLNSEVWEANSDSTDHFHKITIQELKLKLIHHYDPSIIHKYSSALDIIACFIKAQSFLYNESSNYCKYRLNLLMFPCIFLSTLCSVFSSVSQRFEYGILIIGGVNAVVAFLLAIVNYLKLDAAAEAHHISSNHFSRLKILIEFTSGETLLFENPLLHQNGLEKEVENWSSVHDPEDMEEQKLIYKNNVNEQIKDLQDQLIKALQIKINSIKEKVIEIRENNRFAIPQPIMDHYPIIFNINIFSFIKTVEDYRMGIISTLKNILNEIRFLNSKTMNDQEKERIRELYKNKNYIINELIMLTSTHNLIEVLFQQEIKNHYLYKKYYPLFVLQGISNFFRCKNETFLLPSEYKNPYDCGFLDKSKKSLLRKILNIQ